MFNKASIVKKRDSSGTVNGKAPAKSQFAGGGKITLNMNNQFKNQNNSLDESDDSISKSFGTDNNDGPVNLNPSINGAPNAARNTNSLSALLKGAGGGGQGIADPRDHCRGS